MRTFTILVVTAITIAVSACASEMPGQPNYASTSGTSEADVAAPSSQPNPLAVVIGPSGLHAR